MKNGIVKRQINKSQFLITVISHNGVLKSLSKDLLSWLVLSLLCSCFCSLSLVASLQLPHQICCVPTELLGLSSMEELSDGSTGDTEPRHLYVKGDWIWQLRGLSASVGVCLRPFQEGSWSTYADSAEYYRIFVYWVGAALLEWLEANRTTPSSPRGGILQYREPTQGHQLVLSSQPLPNFLDKEIKGENNDFLETQKKAQYLDRVGRIVPPPKQDICRLIPDSD